MGEFNCVCKLNLSQTDHTAIVTNGCVFEPKIGFNFALYDRYDPESCTGAGVIRITNLTMPVKFVLHIHVSTVNITVI